MTVPQAIRVELWLSRPAATFALAAIVVLALTTTGAWSAEQTFVNPNLILIQDHTNAAPYPSTINVFGFSEVVDKITVTISNLTHPNSQDLDFLLVGPGGQKLLLLSDAGAPASTNETASVTNLTLTFDDFALVSLREFGQLTRGTFRPTDYPPADLFPSNAPAGPYGSTLALFKETNPNGTWQLFVVDDQTGGNGSIGGWSLTIKSHSQVFSNTNPIVVSNTAAIGYPYPTDISFTNVAGSITKVTVTLLGLNHTYPSDLDILLVGPSGGKVMLMSDAGSSFAVTNITLVFDDSAIASLPASSPLQSGSFRPTDHPGSDTFPQPAPAGPYGTNLSVFNGMPANGVWRLFVVDDFAPADGGQITGGWKLSISTEPLAITQHPVGASVEAGSNASFYVSVAGVEPITYQWCLNGFPIPGATNSSLSVASVSTTNTGSYSVSVANPFGVIQSEKARLLLAYPMNLAPDDFAKRRVLTGSSGLSISTNFFASKEPGEPNHAGKQGGSSVWYSWTATAGGIATFDTRGSTFDTLLGIYTGDTLTNLNLVARDEDSGGFFTSRASFNVAANQVFLIAVDGLAGAQGTFALNWNLEITIDLLPGLFAPLPGQTVPAGTNVTLSVPTSGSGANYQWSLNGRPIVGATGSTLTVTNVQVDDVGTYRLTATTAAGRTAPSEPMVLEIGAYPEIQSRAKIADVQFIGEAFYSGVSPSSLFSTNYASVPAGTRFGLQAINIFGGSPSPRSPCLGLNLTRAKYIGLIPTDDGEFIVNTAGSTISTRMNVYRLLNDYGETVCVGGNDDSPSYLRFPARAGEKYIVAVDGAGVELEGAVVINWTLGTILLIERKNATQARLSWYDPTNAYHLESTFFLSNPPLASQWSPAIDLPSPINTLGTRLVDVPTLPMPPTNRFFRLVKPPPPGP